MLMKDFALIGAAGYIAPRHMRAIKDTGNRLVAALDGNDTVGILDSHFPEAHFFTEFERFDRFVDLRRRGGEPIDYVSVTSPNYLHDSHIRFALRSGANAICEKPLVVNPWNIDALRIVEEESGLRVSTILQLRLHPAIIALREKVAAARAAGHGRFAVDLVYMTSRGRWYFQSWKGEEAKSGGIAANIGIHFFDMLLWVFGEVESMTVNHRSADSASGTLHFKDADVRWFMTLNADHLPAEVTAKGQRTYRSVTLDGEEVEFSDGFTDLHTDSYRHILSTGGFGLADAAPSIHLVHNIRSAAMLGRAGDYHPLAAAAIPA
jgi:UDP-N-acetyl-2-amino-2-deoxyglucuronate dehydrogenase